METSSIPQVAVVGCGHRFRTGILPVLREYGARLAAIVEPDRGNREKAAREAGPGAEPVVAAELTAGLLRAAAPDLAVIASPSALHFDQARLCLAAGLPTFVEKPLACRAQDAVRLRAMGGKRLAASEQRVHRSDLRLVRDAIASGRLGRLSAISYRDTIAPAASFTSSWRNRPALAGGGVLLDLGYHTVNTLQWLLDSSFDDLVLSSAQYRYDALAVEYQALIRCTAGGVALSLDIGLDAADPREDLRVRGSSGEIRVNRRRGGDAVSTIGWAAGQEGGMLMSSHRFDVSHDTRSLREFMGGHFSAASLDRHVATVRALEWFYEQGNGMDHFR